MVSVGGGKEIAAGDTTHIGGATVGGSNLLHANEYVDANANAISSSDAACSVLGAMCVYQVVLGLEAGAGDHTGYGASAFYAFSNFAFSTNSKIVAVTVDSTGISGLGTLNTKQGRVSVVNGVVTDDEPIVSGGRSVRPGLAQSDGPSSARARVLRPDRCRDRPSGYRRTPSPKFLKYLFCAMPPAPGNPVPFPGPAETPS